MIRPALRIITITLFFALAGSLAAQSVESGDKSNTLEVFPIGEINMLQYIKALTSRDSVMAGLIWYDPQIMGAITYPGEQRVLAAELGFRRYIVGGLHLEGDALNEWAFLKSGGATTSAYLLALELRVGYRFSFDFGKIGLTITPQLFGGWYGIDTRPAGFIQADRSRALYPFYWSPIPMILLGISY